jgi:hypothetical protein
MMICAICVCKIDGSVFVSCLVLMTGVLYGFEDTNSAATAVAEYEMRMSFVSKTFPVCLPPGASLDSH